jgi:chromosome segregation ATPase
MHGCDSEEGMKIIEELEAELETVTRERDKLSVLVELSDGYRRERDEARADAAMLEDRLAESRSEVERLADERDELLVRVADAGAELRATREAYNGARAELTRERIGIRPVDEVRSDAYRRGAEAMREACARVADAHCVPGTRDVIRALPIPEEP